MAMDAAGLDERRLPFKNLERLVKPCDFSFA